MINIVIFLVLEMFLLIKGADFFVDGTSDIAKILKIPSFIIALTLVAFATSFPEIAVSAIAASQNIDSLSFGNVVGSNVFNFFVVIGISSLFFSLKIKKKEMIFETYFLILSNILLFIFGFIISPYVIELFEGIILILFFGAFITFQVIKARKSKKENIENEKPKNNIIESIMYTVVGLIMIVLGGQYVTDNASLIAIELGMSKLLVGLTITALGTSAPELITSVIAAYKKEDDIAIGNILGSNITNTFVALGLSASITNIYVIKDYLIDLFVLLFGSLYFLYIIYKKKKISKEEGILLLFTYIFYLVYIINRN